MLSLIGHAPGATGAATVLMPTEAVLAEDYGLNSLSYLGFAGLGGELSMDMPWHPALREAKRAQHLHPQERVMLDSPMLGLLGRNILCHDIALQLRTAAKTNFAGPFGARLKKWTRATVSPTISVYRIDGILPPTTYISYQASNSQWMLDLLSGAYFCWGNEEFIQRTHI